MKIKTGFIFVVFLSLIVFAGCTNPQNDSKESEALVLKSYEVPERFAKEVSETINDLLSKDADKPENSQPPIGKATIAPDGQILVAAPKSFHDGLKDFIASLASSKPEPSLSTEVNYWIVAGRKANKPATFEEFNTIKPALETIQNNQGSMEFKLLDHIILTSSGQGTTTRLDGELFNISQTLSAYSDGSLGIGSYIGHQFREPPNMSYKRYSINTQIETQSGKLVVLGQVSQGFNMPIFTTAEEGKPHYETVSVFYIISASVKK